MQITPLIATIAVVAGVAAPAAEARVAADPTQPVAAAPAQMPLAGPAQRFGAIAAHRGDAAQGARPVALEVADGGFDWSSALLGGSVPLVLILLGLSLRPSIGGRRRLLA